MAAIIPSTAFLPRTIHLGLSRFDRRTVERQIEALIELLDRFDGDSDLEDDELGEDPLDSGEAVQFVATPPRYGADQSRGPVNAEQAEAEYRRLEFAGHRRRVAYG